LAALRAWVRIVKEPIQFFLAMRQEALHRLSLEGLRLLALATSALGERCENLTAYRRTAWDENALVAVVRGAIAR
jgi:hypothetical protein